MQPIQAAAVFLYKLYYNATKSTSVDTEISDFLKNGGFLSSMCNNVKESSRTSITDLSSKINDFMSKEAGLHNHITDTAKALNSISHSSQIPDKSPDNTVDTIEEFAERERRKCNIIVFNLKESTTADADKDSFIDLCHTALKLKVKVIKFFSLGRLAP